VKSIAKTLCIATRYGSIAELIERLHPFCDATSIFVATRTTRTVGERRPFALQLADHSFALRGWCTVLDVWDTADNRFGRPGIRLGLERLTRESQHVFDALCAPRPDGSVDGEAPASLTSQLAEAALAVEHFEEPIERARPVPARQPRASTRWPAARRPSPVVPARPPRPALILRPQPPGNLAKLERFVPAATPRSITSEVSTKVRGPGFPARVIATPAVERLERPRLGVVVCRPRPLPVAVPRRAATEPPRLPPPPATTTLGVALGAVPIVRGPARPLRHEAAAARAAINAAATTAAATAPLPPAPVTPLGTSVIGVIRDAIADRAVRGPDATAGDADTERQTSLAVRDPDIAAQPSRAVESVQLPAPAATTRTLVSIDHIHWDIVIATVAVILMAAALIGVML
jgi:hypothetical protein